MMRLSAIVTLVVTSTRILLRACLQFLLGLPRPPPGVLKIRSRGRQNDRNERLGGGSARRWPEQLLQLLWMLLFCPPHQGNRVRSR